MPYRQITFWKEAPFFRLIIPFAVGIVIEKYFQLHLHVLVAGISAVVSFWILLAAIPLRLQFALRPLLGLVLNAAFIITGALTVRINDTSLSGSSFSRLYQKEDVLAVRILEAVTETKATYKTKGSVFGILRNDSVIRTTGNILLYFRKDSLTHRLNIGN